MAKIIRIGMDTSKSVFQLHGVDAGRAAGAAQEAAAEPDCLSSSPSLRRRGSGWRRAERRIIGRASCARWGTRWFCCRRNTSKPYVKRGKNDAADAEAICEAMSRPTMRFVPVKTAEQQAALMLAGMRERLIRRRTQLSQRDPRLCGRVRAGRGQGTRQDRAAAGAHCRG